MIVERHDYIRARHICRDMVGVCDADIRRSIGRYIRYYVVIDLSVIRIKTEIYGDIGIELLKRLYRLLVDLGLRPVRIVLRPECDLILSACIERIRHDKIISYMRAVARRERCRRCRKDRAREDYGYYLLN